MYPESMGTGQPKLGAQALLPWGGLCPPCPVAARAWVPCLPHSPLALLGLLLPAPELLTLPGSLLLGLALLLRSRCQLLHLPLHQGPVLRAAEPQALGEESEGEGKGPQNHSKFFVLSCILSGTQPVLFEA